MIHNKTRRGATAVQAILVIGGIGLFALATLPMLGNDISDDFVKYAAPIVGDLPVTERADGW